MKKNRLCLAFLAFLLTGYAWASTPSVQLKSERHRTEWNWVEYRLSLKNLSDKPLKNPTIRYFAENPKIQFCRKNPKDASCSGAQFGDYEIDSTLRAEVDYFSTVKSVKPTFQYGSQYTVIELKFSGSIPAQKKSSVNFRIMKKNYPAWDCTHDYSFQKNAAVQEKNYMMAVYDADGNLLWGNDPVALKRDTANVYWNDRSGTTVVSQYNGSDSAKVFDGRFWMLERNSLSYEERKALDSVGVRILESTRYENKDLHLLKAVKAVTKKTLNKVISGFYNAFKVDDATPLSLAVSPDDIYEEKQTCDANGSCSNVVTERLAYDMVVECWPDISMDACKDVVLGCGADEAYIDRRIILANVRKNFVQCLEKHEDVRYVHMHREFPLTLDESRDMINITSLQNDSKWQLALRAPEVTTDWLNGFEYTGEGIIVGVYDTGIDFTHPGFKEKGKDGKDIERKAAGYDDDRTVENGKIFKTEDYSGDHGTHVAGIIGGNGSGSDSYRYRGIAPKVRYQSGGSVFDYQRGHVVNHSHTVKEADGYHYYGSKNRNVDFNIFNDWKDKSEKGDKVTKTVVVGAANNGYSAQYGTAVGYHSILADAKNPITVGALDGDVASMTLRRSSSMGPTWDGRIKPDVMAPGSNIKSSVPFELDGDYYGWMSGTSMAAPHVSGVVALMYQKFGKKTGKLSMRNSTSKALLIHTAIDMDGSSNYINKDLCRGIADDRCPYKTPLSKGPDFATGWGRIDAAAALGMMDVYDGEKFAKFREINVFAGYESRWTIDVSEKKSFRTTLVWDDAPGNEMDVYTNSKLVNDLDLWLVSPSGKIYYPWRLDSLSTQNVDDKGNKKGNAISERLWGLEEISEEAASKAAYKHCVPMLPTMLFESCFDRLNNVEVVDVDAADAEVGRWQVVVKGYRITSGNNPPGLVQIASLACDYELKDRAKSGDTPPPVFELQTPEVRYWGDGYLEHYVYFGPETQFGDGNHILLFDGFDGFIGDFSDENPLANRRIVVKSSFLQMVPVRNNATAPWPKYSMSEVHIPYGVLQVLFPPYKKK